MVNCPDNDLGFSVDLWVLLLCGWQRTTDESYNVCVVWIDFVALNEQRA